MSGNTNITLQPPAPAGLSNKKASGNQKTASGQSRILKSIMVNLRYALLGSLFGIILIKAEVVSWFRIQEMFHLQSFHMFGVIGSAILVGIISIKLIKAFNIKTLQGEPIQIQEKKFEKGQIFGGLIFGFGWALTGACPGPLYAQIGAGSMPVIITLLSAIAGTWIYGKISSRLPH